MDILMEILEILKYILPSVIVLITAYFILQSFMENQLKKAQLETRRQIISSVNPVRLQAYERVILLLERISPNTLVMRIKPQGTVRDLQQELLANIREEFDHNVTQQIYISPGAWEAAKRAKEEIVKLVNVAATRIEPGAPAIELSKMILDMAMQIEKLPTQAAIDAIKNEARTLF